MKPMKKPMKSVKKPMKSIKIVTSPSLQQQQQQQRLAKLEEVWDHQWMALQRVMDELQEQKVNVAVMLWLNKVTTEEAVAPTSWYNIPWQEWDGCNEQRWLCWPALDLRQTTSEEYKAMDAGIIGQQALDGIEDTVMLSQ
jgi:hypothetical protein